MKKAINLVVFAFLLFSSSCDDAQDCNEGCLISKETLSVEESVLEETTYEYDSNNNLISKVKEISDIQTISHSYSYDNSNNLISYRKYQSNGISEDHYYTNNENGLPVSEEFLYGGNYAATYFYTYDSNNNLISKEQYNGTNDTYSQFFEYIYENGLLVEENWYVSNGGNLQSSRIYEYNAGLLILETLYNGNNVYTVEYGYNDLDQLELSKRFANGIQTNWTEFEYDECGYKILTKYGIIDTYGNDTRNVVHTYTCE